MTIHRSICTVAALAVAAIAGQASADVIAQGTYRLHNHPDGGARPPLYGMRLDELYNVTGGNDVFTFDFDHPSSNMQMVYNGTTIHIFGQAYGGRDTGTDYANDQYRGVYSINFLYNVGVGLAPGDDDLLVNPGIFYNYGSLLVPNGDVIGLRDGHYGNGQPDFRFGDEDHDNGHRGFSGLSGWGWLFHTPAGGGAYANYPASDWLFTAELIPTPGAASVMGLGVLAATRRRRR